MKQTNSKKAKKVSNLQRLLQEHPGKFQTISNGKIKCIITGHQFMPTVQNLQAHLKSKSYKKATQAEFDITQYEDVLETHKENKNFIFCRLTGSKIPKKKTAIEKHVNGKRFQKRFQEYLQKMVEVEGQDEDQLVDDEGEQEEIDDEEIEQQEEDQDQQQEEQDVQQEDEQQSEKNDKNKKNGHKNKNNFNKNKNTNKNQHSQQKHKQIHKNNNNNKNKANHKNGSKHNKNGK